MEPETMMIAKTPRQIHHFYDQLPCLQPVRIESEERTCLHVLPPHALPDVRSGPLEVLAGV
jgi:hypothetical protein